MLCRVEMPANDQIYGRFYRYRMLHPQKGAQGGRGALLLPVVALLLCALLFALGLPPLVLVLLVAAALAYVYYSFFMRPAALFRQREGAALQREVTIITANGVQRTVKGEEGGGGQMASAQFAALFGAAETRRDFYIFTSPTEAYLLDKGYFTNGTPEELRALLREKMGDKFHPMRGTG